jgi:hypothetical protein
LGIKKSFPKIMKLWKRSFALRGIKKALKEQGGKEERAGIRKCYEPDPYSCTNMLSPLVRILNAFVSITPQGSRSYRTLKLILMK